MLQNDNIFLQIVRAPVFADVPTEPLSRALSRTSLSVEHHDQGNLIRHRGDACDSLTILLSGTVSAEIQDYEGRVMRIETIAAPNAIASAFLFGRRRRFPVTVTALSDVSIAAIPRKAVIELGRSLPEFLENLLDDMANRASFLAEKLRLTQFATIKQKVADYLLHRMNESDSARSVIEIASQQVLAELFGVRRPSLARVLGEMEEEGVIVRHTHQVEIADRNRLQAYLNEYA